MIPAAYMPESVSGPGGLGSSEAPDSPEDPSQSRQQDEEEVVCLHCGLVTPASDVQQQLVAQITKEVHTKQKRVSELGEEISRAKEKWSGLVESKCRLAEVWGRVLRARSRVALLEQACDTTKKLTRKELEEVQLLERTNKRRAERLRHVGSKDFSQKERRLKAGVVEVRSLAEEKLRELVGVRQQFIMGLYHNIFPIEVLPLSRADAGGSDYYQRVEIDCDRVLELEEGWVLGGVHAHPTPHISIVAPSLPADGDHAPYLRVLSKRSKHKGGMVEEEMPHPLNDPYSSTPAALLYIAHFVELIAWALDQPLPFPLHRPVAISVYGNTVKRKRGFLESVSKLDDNIIYLCFTQNVPPSALSTGHTLQNLLALVTHSQLGRSGPFECCPELVSCKVSSSFSSSSSLRHPRPAARPSPMSHDVDDSRPPSVSYTAESAQDSSSGSGMESEGGEEEEEGEDVSPHKMEWEHLEPSAEEMRLFEEEQMKLTLVASPSARGQQEVAHRHAQQVEDYRQRLRRLDYDTTYVDYAAHVLSHAAAPASLPPSSAETTRSSSSSTRSLGSSTGRELRALAEGGATSGGGSSSSSSSASQQQGMASGILGTLSSLWTSTFGGSRS